MRKRVQVILMHKLSWTKVLTGFLFAVVIGMLIRNCLPATQGTEDYAGVPSWPEYTLRIALSRWLRKAADALVLPANRLLSRAFDLNQLIAIYCCGKLGWPDVLGKGAQTGRVLASHANMSKVMTRRLLRACVVADIFQELGEEGVDDDERRYVNTAMGDALRDSHPYSMKHLIHLRVEATAPGALQLWNAVRDDNLSPFLLAHNFTQTGNGFYEFLNHDPDTARVFHKGMVSIDALGTGALVHDYSWGARCSTVIDVGGGRGPFLAHLLRKYPNLRGTLFEVPSIIDEAEPYWAEEHRELLDRVSFARGDFFDAATIPASAGGGTCYALRIVLHDWGDANAEAILRNVAGRMAAGDRILVMEYMQVENEFLRDRVLFDLLMRTFGVIERTLPEFRRLFAAAGLAVAKAHPTRSVFTIVEGQLAAAR